MKVHWTDNAEQHLDAIHNYIAQNSEEYAKIIVDKLTLIVNFYFAAAKEKNDKKKKKIMFDR